MLKIIIKILLVCLVIMPLGIVEATSWLKTGETLDKSSIYIDIDNIQSNTQNKDSIKYTNIGFQYIILNSKQEITETGVIQLRYFPEEPAKLLGKYLRRTAYIPLSTYKVVSDDLLKEMLFKIPNDDMLKDQPQNWQDITSFEDSLISHTTLHNIFILWHSNFI